LKLIASSQEDGLGEPWVPKPWCDFTSGRRDSENLWDCGSYFGFKIFEMS
jgi:hypothetical protein